MTGTREKRSVQISLPVLTATFTSSLMPTTGASRAASAAGSTDSVRLITCDTSASLAGSPFLGPYRISSCQHRSRSQGAFLARRLRRAVFRLERIFCGPVGPCALVKSPRYFSASRSTRLPAARRNQIGEHLRVLSVVKRHENSLTYSGKYSLEILW
jgi:hypothetical protein